LNKPLKKILIIQTAFPGDLILATSVIEKLHQYFPQSQLDFLLRKGNESLLKGHPFLKNIFILDKNKKFRSMFENILRIRKEKYDLVINIQRFASSGIITALSGARQTVGFSKNPFSIFFTQRIPHDIEKKNNQHEVDRNNNLIKKITDDKRVKPKLYPGRQDEEKVKIYKDKNYICISPASIWFTKQFPENKWIEFINQLEEGLQIYLLGSSSDNNLCQRIIDGSTNMQVGNLAGKLSFLESGELMKDAVINFVNDSAPLHLASQCNAPVCVVYCSTIPKFGFGPLSDFSRIVEIKDHLYCRPCGLHGYKKCPEGHFKCALDINILQLNEVLKEAILRKVGN
jgi:ADP-heptose:LPS heptosyltransferase